jgi:tetratricopeptide (TPR) repeat protein
MRHTLSALLLLALVAAPASAAKLKLKDGTTVNGKVQSYDTATKTLSVKLDGGKDVQYRMDQLDARSVYLVNASLVPKNDARAQLLAANFARDAGLYAHAARRYKEAAELDPALKSTVDAEMTTLRRSAAQMCLTNARAAAAKQDFAEAEKWCKVLIEKLPDEPEAAMAAQALDQHYAQTRATKMAAAEAKASDALKKDVESGKKRYEQMVDKTKKGLQARGSSESKNLYNAALADGQYVLKEIDRVQKEHGDAATSERADSYRAVVTQQMVEVHLHLASLEATKSDYQGAQREVSKALALDPRNEAAISMRARLEDYASRGIGWGLW